MSRPGGGSIEPSRPGALVVHGLTGSPQSVAPLAAAFDGAGFTVEAPLLPGHGTSPEDLAQVGWDDWAAAVEDAYAALARRVDGPVVVAGLSLGGALAAGLAAAHPEVAGLVAVNPFVDPPAPSFQALLADLLAAGEPYLPGIGGDVADADAREDAYDRLPVAAFLSASRGLDRLAPRLGRIRCPLLIVTSRHDHVVPTVSSDVLAAAVSGPVERVWLERSQHVATLDVEHADLERHAVDFAARAVAGAPYHDPVPLLSRDDVAHVARLARLDVTDDELDRFATQLAAVLEHAADVAALDTAGIPPTAHPFPLVNVLRDDVVGPSLDRDEVLAQAPAAEGGRFRVPRILGEAP